MTQQKNNHQQDQFHPASFRDHSGYVFWRDDKLYRVIYSSYKNNYDLLINSGLYEELVSKNLLIPHQEVSDVEVIGAYKVISPKFISVISYANEWCFSQLKDAALTTLKIQEIALKHGMVLKDANTYNIQFYEGKLVLIDTLSFEKYENGQPWQAYRQFCQHFLAPLVLASYVDSSILQTLNNYLEGFPLNLTKKLLPFKAKWRKGILLHLVAQANAEKKYQNKKVQTSHKAFSKDYLLFLNRSLKKTIEKLSYQVSSSWAKYYSEDTTATYTESKKSQVNTILETIQPKLVWDIGGNVGLFSKSKTGSDVQIISMDNDHDSIEKQYLQLKESQVPNILPLIIDITNPSSGFGWQNKERKDFLTRSKPECILALALIHHLVFRGGIPLWKLASFFSKFSPHLLIEFIPIDDPKVQLLVQNRNIEDLEYSFEFFEKHFEPYFWIKQKVQLEGTRRFLYWMERKLT